MFILEQEFQNDGYATWFKLLEALATTDNHFLDMTVTKRVMLMAAKCHISKKRLTAIINKLAELDEIDRGLWDQCSVVYSQKFVDSVTDAYRKRSNDIIDHERLLQHLHSLGRNIEGLGRNIPAETPVSGVRNTQSKVKDSRGKERKGKGKAAKPPTLKEVEDYFLEKGFSKELARRAFEYYDTPRAEKNGRVWKDGNGKTIINWKQKMIGVWFKNNDTRGPAAKQTGNQKLDAIQNTDYESKFGRGNEG